MEWDIRWIKARPHPGPLPRGEGERFAAFRLYGRPPSGVFHKTAATATIRQPFQERRVLFSLSSGERAGVRADVSLTNKSAISN